MKANRLQLAPFAFFITTFFAFFSYDFLNSNLLSTSLKCAPMLSLIGFCYFKSSKLHPDFRFHKKIFYGLVFSCIGDAFLDYEQYDILFQCGMLSFAIAQFCYITAFGWKPLNPIFGVVSFALASFGKLNIF